MDEIGIPSGLNVAEVASLLKQTQTEADLRTRIDVISARLIGRPYVENSLIGGPELPEVLTISLDMFDCVTYIETVLALATARTVGDFITAIPEMRYEQGDVDWRRRNHFMIDWANNNEARGLIRNLTTGAHTVEKTRLLGAVTGLPPRRVTFRCFPKRRLATLPRVSETGDVILFASTRKWLDVFHVGLLLKTGHGLLMRHATRAAGRVVEEALSDFMSRNRMSGFMLLRPFEGQGR